MKVLFFNDIFCSGGFEMIKTRSFYLQQCHGHKLGSSHNHGNHELKFQVLGEEQRRHSPKDLWHPHKLRLEQFEPESIAIDPSHS